MRIVSRKVVVDVIWALLFAAMAGAVLLIIPGPSRGSEGCGACQGQCPRAPSFTPRVPQPAWRYERPTGHRAAVVRVIGQDGEGSQSVGSGVLVRWSGRIVVLTARHVIRDAKNIIVELHTMRRHTARVLKVDAVWDCAVLELTSAPEGVEPAEVELGQDAMLTFGARLESCGYGPDGKLACNSGLFLGYRRSAQAAQGPDDWFVLSGHARGGDSGGPVFNQRGRLVGVLWGTDGAEVVGVQAGRIHLLLDAALPRRIEQKTHVEPVGLQRIPTTPKATPKGDCPDFCVNKNGTVPLAAQPLLPWRGEAQRRDETQQAAIDRLIKLERMRGERQERTMPPVVAQPPAKIEPENNETFSPIIAGLCILGAVAAGFVIFFAVKK
jgi:hypothetical protein